MNKTNFSDIKFNKEYHTYTYVPTGKRLTSVTKITGQLKPPFARDEIAGRLAAKQGRAVETILAEWDKKAEEGRRRGTMMHGYIEGKLWGLAPQGDVFLAMNERLPEMDAFDACWARVGQRAVVNQVEWVIGDAELRVAGTCDALLYDPLTRTFHIWDWKTGSKFETANRFENLLEPFADLSNCELNCYSLQASLYRLIVERNTDHLVLGDSYIVYLSNDGQYHIHKALDLRERLLQYLLGNSEEAGK